MGVVREYLKRNKLVRCVYFGLRRFLPQRIYFENNMKRVVKFDEENGTNFGGRLYWDEIGTNEERAKDYSPSPLKLVETLDKMNITQNDKIVDMGCGKGYAMYLMSKYDFGTVGGVELSTDLCKIAEDNLEKMMPQDLEWNVYNSDAALWNGYDEYNFFYMYNPFPKEVLIEVKKKIEMSIKKRPRKVIVLYLMPAYAEVFCEDTENWEFVSRGGIFEQKRGMNIFASKIM